MTDEQLAKLRELVHNKFNCQFPNEKDNVVTLCTEYYRFTGFYHIQLLIPDCVNMEYQKKMEKQLIELLPDYIVKTEMTNVQFHDKVVENDEEVILLELNFYIGEVKNAD